ncbi:MAG: hypothetical protein V3U88_10150 [Methylococcales bacterium]
MRASDLGGDSLTVQWSLLMIPPGSLAMLRAPTAVMSILVVDQPGQLSHS